MLHPPGFPTTLFHLREAQGLTQRVLAARVGVPKSYISDFECGTKRPQEDLVQRLAHVLGVDVEQLQERQ